MSCFYFSGEAKAGLTDQGRYVCAAFVACFVGVVFMFCSIAMTDSLLQIT